MRGEPIIPTPEQKAVIEHPMEPLRVSAGAGTGKTTTMALRLSHLIATGEVAPEEALGVTFTRKATRELADRIAAELADFTAEGRTVEVTTYHGFAHQILTEFGPIVGVERSAKVITPGYTRQLMRDALGAGTYQALDLTAVGHRVRELAQLDGQLGDHLASPHSLIANVFATGEVEDRRKELATTLVTYQDMKRRLGVVDYQDLIRLAHLLVNEHPDIAARIRDRYRVVLLDEYQDTNPAQRSLFASLFGGGFPVTAVGDADQTIYEWRGASLANFARFPEDFPTAGGDPASTLPLTLNRRSGPEILSLANAVRSQIGDDVITGSRDLQPAADAEPAVVQTAWFRTPQQEARWIADEVSRLHDEEGMRWRDIAVLFRRNSSIPTLRDALEARDIPTEVASLGGLLFVPEVADLHAWLRILGRPDDAPALVRILTGAHYRLGLGDLRPLATWVRGHDQPDDADDERPWVLLEAIEALDEVDDLRPGARSALERFSHAYRTLLTDAQSTTLVELCRRILATLGFWIEVASLSGPARLSARLNLYRFLDLAEEWSPLVGRPSLDAFLDYLDLLLEEETSTELDTAQLSTEDAVPLLTVHRAKGLEWEAVFLPAVCTTIFPAGVGVYDDPMTSPSRLPFGYRSDAAALQAIQHDPKALRAELAAQHQAQEWRVAYVAVTRAKRHLTLTGAYWHAPRTARAPSELFELATRVPDSISRHHEQNPGDPPDIDELRPQDRIPAPDPHFDEGWQAVLRLAAHDPEAIDRAGAEIGAAYDAQVDQLLFTLDGLPDEPTSPDPPPFVASVSDLVTLASCPKRYYWSAVDPLPRRPAAWLRRGIDFHRKVELHNLGVIPLDDADEAVYDVVGDADVGGGEGLAAGSAFDRFLGSRFADMKPRWVEAAIDIKVGEGRVRGRIDAVYEPEPGTWEIVDYKSGRHRPDAQRRVQLQAYAVAVADGALSMSPPDQVVATFAYFGGDALVEEREIIDGPWLEEARRTLDELVAQAQGDSFDPVPSPACATCDFVSFCAEGTAFLTSGSAE